MWDPALVEEVGRALGREAVSKSAHVLLAPTVNLHRTPIGGRNFECPSEDPVLAAEVAVAYVRGVQHERVAACIKHFVGNDTEFERMTISSDIDERTLREMYLVPFEAAVRRAGVRAIMTGYNKLNGTFCSEHEWLLADLLRGEWGFDGAVVSDWFGTHSAAASLLAGLDIEMPGPPRERGARLLAAVEAGEVSEDDLDVAVARLLALGAWTGAGTAGTAEVTADDAETRAVIRRGATRAMVLLKNDAGLLPLGPTPRRVALIGPYARYGRPQGGGSARVRPDHGRGPLEALEARGLDVTFEPGGSITKYLPTVRGDFTLDLSDEPGASADVAGGPPVVVLGRSRRPPGIDATGSRRPHRRGVRARRHGGLGDRHARRRAGRRPARRRHRRRADRGATRRRLLRHGQPRGAGHDRAGGRPALSSSSVDYPAHAGGLVRGLVVGARLVPDADHIARATAVAAAAELAIVIVGTDDDWETEGEDRTSLALPGDQDELVAAVVAANPNTVVVLNTGSPVTMPWLDEVPAVLQLWFPGQEIGDALADVLTGDVRTGGRLPVTFPRAARGHAGVRQLPRHRRPGRVRRRAVHRLPLVRPGGHRAAVPVRVRPRLHHVLARARR